MQIEDDPQTLRQRAVDRPVQHLEPGVGQGVLRGVPHRAKRVQVDADRLESTFLEHAEVLFLEASILPRAPDRVITEDIHSPAQPLILFESGDLPSGSRFAPARRGVRTAGRQGDRREENQGAKPPGCCDHPVNVGQPSRVVQGRSRTTFPLSGGRVGQPSRVVQGPMIADIEAIPRTAQTGR